jgi:cell division protease FtsH
MQRQGNEPARFSFVWVLVALIVAALFIQILIAPGGSETLAYSEVKALVRQGQVSEVVVADQTVSGTVSLRQPDQLKAVLSEQTIEELRTQGGRFSTPRVEDPDLIEELEAAGIRYTGQARSRLADLALVWGLPLLLFFVLWMFLLRRMGGAGNVMSLGKSKARVYYEPKTGVSFDDVAGIEEARAEIVEIVDFLKNPDTYRRLGGRIPKGVLLVGSPGTGKTLLAKAVAGEADVPFFSLNGSDFVEMFVGVGAARVRDLFEQAQAKAPSIVFIDELDAVGKARGVSPVTSAHDEREQTLNQLLAELDGFDSQRGVIILGATNRPEILDQALLRPGRFDRQIVIDQPDVRGREKILRVHTRAVPLAPSVELGQIAARTPGLVGADLANLVNEAALRGARLRKDAVDMDDIDWAIDRVIAGLERKSRVISPREKAIVAHHEAGHAVTAESRRHVDPVAKISIIPRGIAALGHTQQLPQEDRYLTTRAELLDRLDVLLGGRVAEELVFGDVSTGAQDDLRRATAIVRAMIVEYGMGEAVGLATFASSRSRSFLSVQEPEDKQYSEATAHQVDQEIRRVLDEAHARVRRTLIERRPALDAVARLLMEQEVVTRDALVAIVSERGQPAAA